MMQRKGIVSIKGKAVTLSGPELKIGQTAPDFIVLDKDFKEVRLKDFKDRIKVITVTLSLYDPTCDRQARRFNKESSELPDEVVVLNISMDLPYVLEWICSTAGLDKVLALSDHRDASFGNAYGVLIKEHRLLAHSIFIIDKNDRIRYIEIVPEVMNELNYDKAIEALKLIIGG